MGELDVYLHLWTKDAIVHVIGPFSNLSISTNAVKERVDIQYVTILHRSGDTWYVGSEMPAKLRGFAYNFFTVEKSK